MDEWRVSEFGLGTGIVRTMAREQLRTHVPNSSTAHLRVIPNAVVSHFPDVTPYRVFTGSILR